MSHEEIYKLNINDLVSVRRNKPEDGFFLAKVKCIDDYKKLVGVLVDDNYMELPYRLIASCI